MKKKKVDTHRDGKRCGYEQLENGDIIIAPRYRDAFINLNHEVQAIDLLLASVTRECQKILKSIAIQKESLWNEMADDYSLNRQKFAYTIMGDVLSASEMDERK
jgi:hypothetical protein